MHLFAKNDPHKNFWKWFSKNSTKYYHFEQDQDALFHSLKVKLSKLDPNLVFEFSPIMQDGKREFVISADGIKTSFDLITELVSKAPKLLKWKVIAFRQPKPVEGSFHYRGIQIDFENIYFSYKVDGGKIGLDMFLKGYVDSIEWTNLTFLLLDYVIGEYDTEMYLSWIKKHPLTDSHQKEAHPIAQLPQLLKEHKIKLSN